MLITYSEDAFTNHIEADDDYRVPLPSESRVYELTGLAVERYVVGPPGTSANIVKSLSDAMGKAASNPELKAMAAKTGEPLDYIPADRAQAAFNKSLAIYEKYKTAIRRK